MAAVDPDKLQRVVMNLLGNAFKFVPDGGRVRCSLRQSPHEIVVAVDDSGPGVKPELRQAIFERFRQGDGGINRKPAAPGSGWRSRRNSSRCTRGGSRCSTPTWAAPASR